MQMPNPSSQDALREPPQSSKPQGSRKKWLLAITSTLLAAFVCEFVVRGYVSEHRQANALELHEKLGWRTLADKEVTIERTGYEKVTFSTHAHGFRRYGDLRSTKPKILVIGDSYTFAETVNDGEAYYDHLAVDLNAEVFAYGCVGYGTLQELMVLKQHFEELAPDLVIWQMCLNDFVNNSHALESRDRLQNNFMVRPYRIGEDEEKRYPAKFGRTILAKSQIARLIHRRMAGRTKVPLNFADDDNKRLLDESLDLTAKLLSEAKSHVGDTPMLVFNNRHSHLYRDALGGFDGRFTSAVENAIEAAVREGRRVDARPNDFHWNREGHKIVGDTLVRLISGKDWLEKAETKLPN